MAQSQTFRQFRFLSLSHRRQLSQSSSRRQRAPTASASPQRCQSTSVQSEPAPSPARPFTELPGPLALPMLKHSAHILPRIGNFHHSVGLGLLERLRARYGDLVRLARGARSRPVLYVFDPTIMQQVYESDATSPQRWEKSPLSAHRLQLGAAHQLQEGDVWSTLRTLLKDPSVVNRFDQTLEDIATDATRRLGELRHAENALNEELETEIYRWTLEVIGVVTLGTRLGCLDGSPQLTSQNRFQKTSIEDDTPDVCSLSKKALAECSPSEQLVRLALRISHAGLLMRSESTLNTASKTFNEALVTFDRHYRLVEHFLDKALCDPDDEKRVFRKLQSLGDNLLPLAANALLAGVEPLAHSAIAMLYHLSLHAAAQQRAHDELSWLTSDHKDRTSSSHRQCPSMNSIKHPADLPYIAACAREVLRMHPATGGVVRRSKGDFVLAGYEIPAGVDIVLAHGVSSKHEAEWGRGDAYIPDRWCPQGWEPLRVSRAHPCASKPFGEHCPASSVVPKMLASLAAKVLDRYRLEWHGPAPNLVTTGVNRLEPPYYFVLRDAS